MIEQLPSHRVRNFHAARRSKMKQKIIYAMAAVAVVLSVVLKLAAEDRFMLKTPNGIAFSEFKDYEIWQYVAPSQSNDTIKIISANPVMIAAYKANVPFNGKPVPDGAVLAKTI